MIYSTCLNREGSPILSGIACGAIPGRGASCDNLVLKIRLAFSVLMVYDCKVVALGSGMAESVACWEWELNPVLLGVLAPSPSRFATNKVLEESASPAG